VWEQYRDALRGRRLPLAFCDLEMFDANAGALAGRAGGVPLRVASKSVRCVALLERVLASSGWHGVLCFSAAEGAFLASRGLDDLVVAYPTVEPSDVAAACERIAAGARITLMVDDEAQLALLGPIAREHGVVLPLCIDVDVSSSLPGLRFGVYRSPVRDAAGALRVARAIVEHASLRLDGVMGYEAQIAGLPDAVPGKRGVSAAVRALKRRSIPDVRARRGAVVDALRADGHTLRFVNGGGTGSIESTRDDPSVTEIAAGSGLYAPALFDGYAGFRHLPAAGFALPVTRRPAAGIVTCHGGGYVASGAPGRDKLPVPYLPAGGALLRNEGAGEVQTPVRFPPSVRLAIGDPVFFRHAKAGELCERFDTLVLLAGGVVVDEVRTYRGDGCTFV